jgi:KipI family sensor histidine kinase inhibitor
VPPDAEGALPIRCCGDDLLSIAVAEPAACQQLAYRLRDSGNWLECVAGIDSVVVQFDATRFGLSEARRLIYKELEVPFSNSIPLGELLEVPVRYGGEYGPDLDDLCEQLDLSTDEIIALHTGREYRVDMLGFTPGFAYIGGLDDVLNVPRLSQPRMHVPAGSIGIADGRTGVYALPGPGGWPIIGRTALSLFDPLSDQPFLLRAGSRVRFVAARQENFQAMTKS